MALIDSLVAAWEMDEASGTRVDSHGSNDLTDNNTVGSGTGHVLGTAADFEKDNSEYLSRADNADLSGGDADMTVEMWLSPETVNMTQALFAKHNGATVAGSEYLFQIDGSTSLLKLEVYSGAGSSDSLSASTFGALSGSTWVQAFWWHDSVANQIGIAVNAGTADTKSWSLGLNDTTTVFNLGALNNGSLPYDGLMGPVRVWRRVLTSLERTELYNAGSGRDYAYIAGGSPPATNRRRRILICGAAA